MASQVASEVALCVSAQSLRSRVERKPRAPGAFALARQLLNPPIMNARILCLAALAALTACKSKAAPTAAPPGDASPPAGAALPAPVPAPAPVTVTADDLAFFAPLPDRFESDENPITPEKVTLGRMLFYEPRLSLDHDVSCNSCHDLASYGVDHEPTSTGHRGQHGGRNAPTVYNAGGHVAQFWDGRAKTLEAQAKGPVLNPIEMAMPSDKAVVAELKTMPDYVAAFRAAFPKERDPVTFDNMARAIGAFERKLVTPSRFDRFLEGDKTVLAETEKAGLVRFVRLGCPSCHNGPAVGGGSFQRLGLVNAYPDQHDPGRFVVTKQEADRMVFRVPSLRNVAQTAPYFHDGSIQRLEDVVRKMAHHQLGVELTDEDVRVIVAFLNSLTGDIPSDYVRPPAASKGPTG